MEILVKNSGGQWTLYKAKVVKKPKAAKEPKKSKPSKPSKQSEESVSPILKDLWDNFDRHFNEHFSPKKQEAPVQYKPKSLIDMVNLHGGPKELTRLMSAGIHSIHPEQFDDWAKSHTDRIVGSKASPDDREKFSNWCSDLMHQHYNNFWGSIVGGLGKMRPYERGQITPAPHEIVGPIIQNNPTMSDAYERAAQDYDSVIHNHIMDHLNTSDETDGKNPIQ